MRLADLHGGRTTPGEPVLTGRDRRLWQAWCAEALAWSRTLAHRARVESAQRAVEEMHAGRPGAYVAWSGGKDSTAMTHLVRHTLGEARAMSVKDDLDFPGEEDYIGRLAREWGVALDVVRPPVSLQAWLAEHADALDPRADMHSRSAGLSAAFYGAVAEYAEAAGRPGVYLGLRQEESAGRRMNRASRGRVYRKADGDVVCTPLADWRGVDVYAYLLSRGIDLLPLYRCVGQHEHPSRVRKSWWVPGAAHDRGGARWLRTYYPSLWARLVELVPAAAYYD